MFKQIAFSLLASAIVATNADAATGLEGKYKITKEECASGAPARDLFSGDVQGSFSAQVVFSSTRLEFTAKIEYKYNSGAADSALKQIKDAAIFWEQQPDSPDKTKNLDDLKKNEALISQLMVGTKCSVKGVRSYSVNGSVIHTEPVSYSNDCPGNENANSNKPEDSTFELKGDVLKVTSSTAQADDKGTCPKGDHVVSVF